MKPIILIDGSSYLYRAFHAMPSLANSKGFPTGAVYGMVNMLRKLMKDYDPTHVAVIFDAKGKTFRDDLYDKYKANRKEMPNDLIQQIEPIHAFIKAMGIPILMIEGVEADDVIGTLANEALAKKIDTLISTGDKDLAQLVNEHVTLVNTMTDNVLNTTTVKEKFGIPPERIVDYLALVGDSIDNIPGVPSVGPKTAVKWLLEYGSLDNIIQNADKITGKVGENLRAALTQLPLARELATIKLDVKLDTDLSSIQRIEPDNATLITLCQQLEFKTWLSELLEKNPQPNQTKYSLYEIIFNEEKLAEWITTLKNSAHFSFHIETNSVNYMEAKLVGVAFSVEKNKAAYIPFAHDYENAPTQLSQELVLKLLKPLLEDEKLKKIAHNVKYVIQVLGNHNINLRGIAYDTMLESYVLDSTSNKHELDALALKYLGWRTIPLEEIAGKGAKQISFNHVPVEKAGPYAAEQADMTLQLHNILWPRLEENIGLKQVFETIEMPLIPVLARMECHGVLIDGNMLEKQTLELEKRLVELEAETFKIAGGPFNMNSPKQLQEILFEKLKLPILQKTPTGQPSTADSVLQELALEFQLPKLIIEYRSLSKLITTYTKKLPTQINPRTHRIHTCFNQTVTATGRLSCSEPNLQNIPVRTQEGRRIRQAFIAPKGYKIISADYSQIELRLMSHISSDAALLRAFENNLDIHQATAAEVLGVSLEKVSAEERRSAKAINFGLIYGMSAFGLAKQIGVDRNAAQQYIDLYFTRYPGVKNYMDTTRAQARASGFVETLWGRRLYLPDINSSQIPRQKAAERTAINAPLQGSAADIIKRAMLAIDKWLQESKLDAKMIMQVHDELVFEVAEKDVATLKAAIATHMMNAAKLKVPLNVAVGVGDNWDAASSH